MVIQVYAPTSNTEEAERFYEDLHDLLELTSKKDVLFITGDWNAKVDKTNIQENIEIPCTICNKELEFVVQIPKTPGRLEMEKRGKLSTEGTP